jgi:hypothetical protein
MPTSEDFALMIAASKKQARDRQHAQTTNSGFDQQSAEDYDLQAATRASLADSTAGAAEGRKKVERTRGFAASVFEKTYGATSDAASSAQRKAPFSGRAIATPQQQERRHQPAYQAVPVPGTGGFGAKRATEHKDAERERAIEASHLAETDFSLKLERKTVFKKLSTVFKKTQNTLCVQRAFAGWRLAKMQAKADDLSRLSFKEGQVIREITDELDKTNAELNVRQDLCVEYELKISQQEEKISAQEETISAHEEKISAQEETIKVSCRQVEAYQKMSEAAEARVVALETYFAKDSHTRQDKEMKSQDELNVEKQHSKTLAASLTAMVVLVGSLMSAMRQHTVSTGPATTFSQRPKQAGAVQHEDSGTSVSSSRFGSQLSFDPSLMCYSGEEDDARSEYAESSDGGGRYPWSEEVTDTEARLHVVIAELREYTEKRLTGTDADMMMLQQKLDAVDFLVKTVNTTTAQHEDRVQGVEVGLQKVQRLTVDHLQKARRETEIARDTRETAAAYERLAAVRGIRHAAAAASLKAPADGAAEAPADGAAEAPAANADVGSGSDARWWHQPAYQHGVMSKHQVHQWSEGQQHHAAIAASEGALG